jgi:hypothetical protein
MSLRGSDQCSSRVATIIPALDFDSLRFQLAHGLDLRLNQMVVPNRPGRLMPSK